ncbi:uncharacterized protein VTP21DRAFT_985 [Calcarisporiella thermophila]|uniref:uncharacterized protein n=1 Tax=Calcarisporiella thermophila TaxID=911321 RepID=UPI0037449E8A
MDLAPSAVKLPATAQINKDKLSFCWTTLRAQCDDKLRKTNVNANDAVTFKGESVSQMSIHEMRCQNWHRGLAPALLGEKSAHAPRNWTRLLFFSKGDGRADAQRVSAVKPPRGSFPSSKAPFWIRRTGLARMQPYAAVASPALASGFHGAPLESPHLTPGVGRSYLFAEERSDSMVALYPSHATPVSSSSREAHVAAASPTRRPKNVKGKQGTQLHAALSPGPGA